MTTANRLPGLESRHVWFGNAELREPIRRRCEVFGFDTVLNILPLCSQPPSGNVRSVGFEGASAADYNDQAAGLSQRFEHKMAICL